MTRLRRSNAEFAAAAPFHAHGAERRFRARPGG
jgi:hypothetical protein